MVTNAIRLAAILEKAADDVKRIFGERLERGEDIIGCIEPLNVKVTFDFLGDWTLAVSDVHFSFHINGRMFVVDARDGKMIVYGTSVEDPYGRRPFETYLFSDISEAILDEYENLVHNCKMR